MFNLLVNDLFWLSSYLVSLISGDSVLVQMLVYSTFRPLKVKATTSSQVQIQCSCVPFLEPMCVLMFIYSVLFYL